MEQLTVAGVIAGHVRTLREAKGWTQDEAAARLRATGLPWGQSTLSRFEKGEREPTVSELLLLASALGVPTADLLAGTSADQVRVGEAVVTADRLAALLTERDETRSTLQRVIDMIDEAVPEARKGRRM